MAYRFPSGESHIVLLGTYSLPRLARRIPFTYSLLSMVIIQLSPDVTQNAGLSVKNASLGYGPSFLPSLRYMYASGGGAFFCSSSIFLLNLRISLVDSFDKSWFNASIDGVYSFMDTIITFLPEGLTLV